METEVWYQVERNDGMKTDVKTIKAARAHVSKWGRYNKKRGFRCSYRIRKITAEVVE